MRDTLIGLQGNDMAWWSGEQWTPNLFRADKFESNEATLMVHRMGKNAEGEAVAFTEHESVAAKRYFEMTKEAG